MYLVIISVMTSIAGPVYGSASPAKDLEKLQNAQTLLDTWQIEDALQIAQKLLIEYPEEPAIALLASRIQHARGHYQSALSLLEFVEASGTSSDYLESIIRSSGGYAQYFDTIESPHFVISYIGKDEIVAHYAKDVLEAVYRQIGDALGLLPAERGHKIPVEIYPDARGLSGATGLSIQEIETSGTIAICKFHRLMIISPLATANGYGWADTLAHEYIHLVVSKKSKNSIPIWLHEGIAKFFESTWNGAAGRSLKPHSEKLLAEAVFQNNLITFDEMHPSMAKLPSQEAAGLAFAEVFTVIEFLTKKFGPSTLPKILELTGKGLKLEQALRKVYKLNLKGVEKAWRKYVKLRKFTVYPGASAKRIHLTANESGHQSEKPLETMDDPEIQKFSRLGELLQLRNHHKAAIVEYKKAQHRAKFRYPTLITRLAKAYVTTKQHQLAASLLQKMLVVHPENIDAHVLIGRLNMDRKHYRAAKKDYQLVNLYNPFNPETHSALAKIYQEEGKPNLAKQEKRFEKLARTPRPRRHFPPLELPISDTFVSIVPAIWGPVLLDGSEEIQAPILYLPLEPGAHRVEYTRANGEYHLKEFELIKDTPLTLLLD